MGKHYGFRAISGKSGMERAGKAADYNSQYP